MAKIHARSFQKKKGKKIDARCFNPRIGLTEEGRGSFAEKQPRALSSPTAALAVKYSIPGSQKLVFQTSSHGYHLFFFL